MFQDPMTSLNPVKRIGRQITESLRFHLHLGRKEADERAIGLLAQVKSQIPDADCRSTRTSSRATCVSGC